MPHPSTHASADDSWRISGMVPEWPSADVGGLRWIEIVATTATRAVWEARYWRHFPTEPEALARVAQSQRGIHVGVDRAGSPSVVKSEYSGYSASKLRRLIDRAPPEQARSPRLDRAIAAYEKDFAIEQAARERIFMETYRRLPLPPPGYYWAPDEGGMRLENQAMFRLWSRRFGYMPGSE